MPSDIPASDRPRPCTYCRKCKVKCDQRKPSCTLCSRKGEQCDYTTSINDDDGRIRRFHRRSRNGCQHCKERRVRCDESRPVCGNCIRKGEPEACKWTVSKEKNSTSSTDPAPDEDPQPDYCPEYQPQLAPTSTTTEAISNGHRHSNGSFVGTMHAQPVGFRHADVAGESSAMAQFAQTVGVSASMGTLDHPVGGTASTVHPQFVPGLSSMGPHPQPMQNHQTGNPDPQAVFNGIYSTSEFDLQSAINALIPYQFPHTTPPPLSPSLLFTRYSPPVTGYQVFPPDPLQAFWDNLKYAEEPVAPGAIFSLPSNSPTQLEDTSIEEGSGLRDFRDLFTVGNVGQNTGQNTGQNPGQSTGHISAVTSAPQSPADVPSSEAYESQIQVMQSPERFNSFFPSVDHRHQFRRFFTETVKSLVVVPCSPNENPWTTMLTPLAFVKAANEDILHDLFRESLISLATCDLSIKLNCSGPIVEDDVFRSISQEVRDETTRRLKICDILDLILKDESSVDMTLACVLALATRDRLIGEPEWQTIVELGVQTVVKKGGSEQCIAASPTKIRRFLVEQIMCVEILGCMTTFAEPRTLSWDNSWLKTESDSLHGIRIIYGWNYTALDAAAKVSFLARDYVSIDVVRMYQSKHWQFRDAINTKRITVTQKIKAYLAASPRMRKELVTETNPWVHRNSLSLQASMDLCLYTVLNDKVLSDTSAIREKIKIICDLTQKAISDGDCAGLLLPLSWAEACSDTNGRQHLGHLMQLLRQQYHLCPKSLQRLIELDWAEFNGVDYKDWEKFLRKRDVFFPIF